MNKEGIHIIAFDVPYPADYGGVIDIFYKIQSLAQKGIKIHLHIFEYGRKQAPELLQYCEKIHYYKRVGWQTSISIRPYIVASRNNWTLLSNLRVNDWPILFEGIHTCFFLNHRSLARRKKIVRLHNVEHDYYLQLAKKETQILKKIYYYTESIKLKWFETVLTSAQYLLAISKNDFEYFYQKFPNTNCLHIQPWVPNTSVNSSLGKGQYILFHGNLSVQENEQAAMLLIEQVLSKLDFPFIIAGKKPSEKLKTQIYKYSNGTLIPNPDEAKMNSLISEAQINLLYSLQNTGIKLKLFSALYQGRYCIANNTLLDGNGLDELVIAVSGIQELNKIIKNYIDLDFTQDQIDKRKRYFEKNYNNQNNTEKLVNIINA